MGYFRCILSFNFSNNFFNFRSEYEQNSIRDIKLCHQLAVKYASSSQECIWCLNSVRLVFSFFIGGHVRPLKHDFASVRLAFKRSFTLSPDYPSDYLLRLSARLSICSLVHSTRCKVTVLWLSVSLSNRLLQLLTVRIVPLTISICQSIQPFIEGAALWLSYASFYALYGHSLTTFFQTI